MGMSLGSGEVGTTNAVLTDVGAPPSDVGVVVPDPRRWYALGVIAIAQLMVVLDSSIVNLALPSAKRALAISDANQQWVVTAYTLAFGGLLLLGGRVADYAGRKRMFIIGLLGFAGASALGGLAPAQGLLFAARALQGGFGALLVPAALCLISVTFPDLKERARAFAVYGAIAGGGAAIGLLVGGVLTEYASWRWCLLVNVPIALIAVVGALRERGVQSRREHPLRRPRRGHRHRWPDRAGVCVHQGGAGGRWRPQPVDRPATLSWFGVACVLLVSFFVIETHTKHPLLPMRVLLDRNRGGSYLVQLIVGVRPVRDVLVPGPVPAGGSRVLPAAGRLRVRAVLRRDHPHCRAGREPAAQAGATPADGARAAAGRRWAAPGEPARPDQLVCRPMCCRR